MNPQAPEPPVDKLSHRAPNPEIRDTLPPGGQRVSENFSGKSGKSSGRKPFDADRFSLQKLFDRLPPHSDEAEMSLLGSMILDHEIIDEVTPLVASPDDFYREAHGIVFAALLRLHEQRHSGDLVQLSQALKDAEALEPVGGTDYLVTLASSSPSAANAPHYAAIVREKAQLRKLIDACGEIVHQAYHAVDLGDEGARKVLDVAEKSIFAITEAAAGGDKATLNDLLQAAMEELSKGDGRLVTGISTGFDDLDEKTSGLQEGEMTIIAARPSMGKTALALNLTEHIALTGNRFKDPANPTCPVAFFSLEMSQQSVSQRLLSAHSGVDSHRLRTRRLQDGDFTRLLDSCGILSTAPIYIDDTPGLTVMQLRAKARRLSKQQNIQCIVVDYLQLMSAPEAAREGRQQEVSTISRQIKALARELKLPVICLAQLNRAAEQREGHRPRMADLRESGSIEQDADVIALLHREEYYHIQTPTWKDENPEKVGLAELIIAKQRNGPTGTVKLSWDEKTTRFKNYADPNRYQAAPYQAAVEPKQDNFPPQDTPSYSQPPSAFGSRPKTGPAQNHRDGGGPDNQPPINEDNNLPI